MGWGGFYGQNYCDSTSISSFPFQLFYEGMRPCDQVWPMSCEYGSLSFQKKAFSKIWHSYSSIRRLGLAFLPLNNTDGLCRRAAVWLQMLAFAWPPQLISFYLSSCTFMSLILTDILPWWFTGKKSTSKCRRWKFNPWVRKFPWRRKWPPIPVLLPGKSHGQRSLVGYRPWGCKRVGHSLETKQQQCQHIRNSTILKESCWRECIEKQHRDEEFCPRHSSSSSPELFKFKTHIWE